MNYQQVCQLVEVWVKQGLQHVVLSAGSRSAPLALAFARSGSLKLHVVNDERSAGFIALGIAQATNLPVALVCTSGTAVLNYGPALAEAYYQGIPLLVCSADRPAEWIDQWDGQTLKQTGLFSGRVVAEFQMPQDTNHKDGNWHVNRLANEAWLAAVGALGGTYGLAKGPVHLNFPFREPFYPKAGELYTSTDARAVQVVQTQPLLGKYLAHDFINHWLETERKLVVMGQMPYHHELNNALYAAQHYSGAPLIADIISNGAQIRDAINNADYFLMKDRPELEPTLLVTVGRSVISKNLKLALRKWRPDQHWHIEPTGYVPDVYQSVTHIIRTDPVEFFTRVGEQAFFTGQAENKNDFYTAWQHAADAARTVAESFAEDAAWSDLVAVKQLLRSVPDQVDIHLANSMSVRYANFAGLETGKRNKVFANRGTSGIDGCSSTAVGHALAVAQTTLLLTGDVGFFYDRNAFWHNQLPNNLKIVLLNNAGGNIFRMIEGPSEQPELEVLFETWQGHTAETLAQQTGLTYLSANNPEALEANLTAFWADTKGVVLEIFTNKEVNSEVFNAFKNRIRQN